MCACVCLCMRVCVRGTTLVVEPGQRYAENRDMVIAIYGRPPSLGFGAYKTTSSSTSERIVPWSNFDARALHIMSRLTLKNKVKDIDDMNVIQLREFFDEHSHICAKNVVAK